MAGSRKKGKQSRDGYSKKDQAHKWLQMLAEAHYQLRRSGNTTATAATAATRKESAANCNANGGWAQRFRLRHQHHMHAGYRRSESGSGGPRLNPLEAARFIESYLREPSTAASAAWVYKVTGRTGRREGAETRKATGGPRRDRGLCEWWQRVGESSESGSLCADRRVDEKSGAVVTLTELCCRQIGADLALYGAACATQEGREGGRGRGGRGGTFPTAACSDPMTAQMADLAIHSEDKQKTESSLVSSTRTVSDGSADGRVEERGNGGEGEGEGRLTYCGGLEGISEASVAASIRSMFSLLPPMCLARISLAASLAQAVTDAALPLLCQPSALCLALVGNYTDEGLVKALSPRLGNAFAQFSWECARVEPRLEGCVALESLYLSSPCLTPSCLGEVGGRLSTVKSLTLSRCFNADVTMTAKEVLAHIGASWHYLEELSLEGCRWLSEKAVLKWAGAKEKVMGARGGEGSEGGKEWVDEEAAVWQMGKRLGRDIPSVLGLEASLSHCAPPEALRRLRIDLRLAHGALVRQAWESRGVVVEEW